MLFGPDKFQFKTSNKCLVIPKHHQPSFTYDHSIWEQQFELPEIKSESNSKARCSLEKVFEEVKCINPVNTPKVCVLVPKWGGYAYLQDNVVIKLINTCPVDNYLTILYLYLKDHPQVLHHLSELAVEHQYARCLVNVVQSFDDAAAGTGKVHWLQQFPNFDFSVSSTVDIWGCEQDMFVPCLTPVTTNTLTTTCTSQDCPQKIQEYNRSSIQILDGDVEKMQNKTYLESLFYHWLCPSPKPCYIEFQQQPPPTVPTKLGHPHFVLSDDSWTQHLCCGGTRLSETQHFANGLPWVLPIFLGDLAQTDKLNGPEEIPVSLQISDATYHLGGITFWNRVHYCGRLQYHGSWYDYDGLRNIPLKEIIDVSAPSPVGFIISSCVYFKE